MNHTETFRIVPGQRFLNLSVWLTGVSDPGTEEMENNALTGSNDTAGKQRQKFSLSSLFRLKRFREPAAELAAEPFKEDLKESRLSYLNVDLSEVAADCQLNTQSHHVSTFQLFPADPKASLGLFIIS